MNTTARNIVRTLAIMVLFALAYSVVITVVSSGAEAGRDFGQQPDVTAEQATALADGVVTRVEYAAAIRAEVSCLTSNAKGITIVEQPTWQDGRLTYLYSARTEAAILAANDVELACQTKHSAAIAKQWSEQGDSNASSEADGNVRHGNVRHGNTA